MDIIILGAGRIGSAMAVDLAKEKSLEVAVVDNSNLALEHLAGKSRLSTQFADLSDGDEIAGIVSSYDLVINAVPGFMGYHTLQKTIEAGKNVVDISFFPENPFQLNRLAKQKNVTAVIDCGVAPGLSNILVGRAAHVLENVKQVAIYVGGLPVVRQWPYEYQAGFSPIDVIEEYTRPARLVVGGRQVIRPALSDHELIDFPDIGTLEAFNTDGLRTLIDTIDAPDLKEKTLRYPGHIEKMKILRESGFFNPEPVDVNNTPVSPLALTSRLLFSMWEMKPGDEDLTLLQVKVANDKSTITYHLLDRYDRKTNTTSMARTTGYTATVVARLLLEEKFLEKGIIPPEYLGRIDTCYKYIQEGLAKKGVKFFEKVIEKRISA